MPNVDGRDQFVRVLLVLSWILGAVLLSAAAANTTGVCLKSGSRLSLEQARDLVIDRLVYDQQAEEATHQTYSENRPDTLITIAGEKRFLWRNKKHFRSRAEFEANQGIEMEERRRCEEIEEFANAARPHLARMLGGYRTIVALCWTENPRVEGEAALRRDFIQQSYGISNCGEIVQIDRDYMYRNR